MYSFGKALSVDILNIYNGFNSFQFSITIQIPIGIIHCKS